MGCDIHTFAEQRQPDGTWKCVTPFREVPRDDDDDNDALGGDDIAPGLSAWNDYADWKTDGMINVTPYHARHYALFALLAGVRNYDDEITPLSAPRGVPADISDLGARVIDDFGADGHTHSWYTLAELWEHRFRIAEISREFVDDTLVILHGYVPEGGTDEDVRLVFFFDN